MVTNIEYLHADQIGGCGTVNSFAQISSDILAKV